MIIIRISVVTGVLKRPPLLLPPHRYVTENYFLSVSNIIIVLQISDKKKASGLLKSIKDV